jgi:hypothetical protein
VKHAAVEGLVTALRTLQGDDVADPARAAEYGLEASPYRATLTVQPSGQEARQVTVLIGDEVADKNGGRYARVGDTGPIYIVLQWVWQRLFPTLGTLLELRLLQAPEAEVTALMFEQDGASWSLQRRPAETSAESSTASASPESTSTWQLVDAPQASVDASTITSLLEITAELNADDLLTNVSSQTGLDRPVLRLSLTLNDGRTEHLAFGQPVGQENSGYYASRGDTAEVFIVPAMTYKMLTDTVTKLRPAGAAPATAPPKP